MRILKPEGVEIEFDDKKRHLLFSINIIDEIQESFDLPITRIINDLIAPDTVEKEKAQFKTLAQLYWFLLNDDVKRNNSKSDEKWESISLEFIMHELITNANAPIFTLLLTKAFFEQSTSEKSEKGNENDPNQKSGNI